MHIKDKPVVNMERAGRQFSKDIPWPEGTPDEIIKYMEQLKLDFKDIEALIVEPYWSGYEDCYYQVRGIKYENDQEMEKRILSEKDKLKKWEERFIVWMETTGKKKAEKEQAKLDEQLRQFNLLKEKLEKAGKLPIDN